VVIPHMVGGNNRLVLKPDASPKLRSRRRCHELYLGKLGRRRRTPSAHDELARMSAGSPGKQGEDLPLLSVLCPAAVEQQRAQRGQCIACLLAPVAPLSLLPAGYQQIIELLRVPTAHVLARRVALPIVGQERAPGAQIGPQLLQRLRISGLGPTGLHKSASPLPITTPQTALHREEEALFGQVAPTDPAAHLGACLAEAPPVQDHQCG